MLARKKYFILLGCLVIITTLVAVHCKPDQDQTEPLYGTDPVLSGVPVYSFAIHPLYNPARLFATYQPFIDYLNKEISTAHFNLEASRDYGAFEEKFRARKPHLLLPNPWQTIQAIESGYHVIAIAGDSADFKGIFIVRKDSRIRTPGDLKGKTVSYPSRTALAACIMPQYFLFRHGIDVNRDIENLYVGSQESSIMNAYLGKSAASATWPPPWRSFQREHPNEASALKVIWETESFINNSVMIRDDVPLVLKGQIQKVLTSLHKSDEGKKLLNHMETSRFFPGSDNDYEVVRSYIKNFEKNVRKVEAQ